MTILLSIIVIICAVSFLYVGVPWIHRQWTQTQLKRNTKKYKSFALTFDDGWSSKKGTGTKLTTAILDMLAEHNAKATFFLLGSHIPGRETVVQRMKIEGHEIGMHGYDHLNYWKVSPFKTLTDVKRGWKAVDTALGTNGESYPFRPPYGKLNLFCLLYLWMRRVPIVYWTFDLRDTWPADKRDSQRIAALAKESDGAVVLAHDFDRIDESTSRMILDSVGSILMQAKKRKMSVLTVSQLLKGHNK